MPPITDVYTVHTGFGYMLIGQFTTNNVKEISFALYASVNITPCLDYLGNNVWQYLQLILSRECVRNSLAYGLFSSVMEKELNEICFYNIYFISYSWCSW
jgi:hypothetical protein